MNKMLSLFGVICMPLFIWATELKVTLYFAPESMACKPDGYPGCEKLSYESDILGWDGQPHVQKQSFSITESSEVLQLSEEMRTLMDDLSRGTHGEGGSAVLVYAIAPFHGQFMSYERVISADSLKHLSKHGRTQYIESGTMLIDHVSINSILPAYNTFWKVTVGADTWEFMFK